MDFDETARSSYVAAVPLSMQKHISHKRKEEEEEEEENAPGSSRT